ncbi:hypothetical protein AVEN_193406-1 [Araneus ventricosus]|uniref:Uncharacterized protein n=2 Tax=Araneus ventricosus TaxID=182803 RepID=A0A4Y2FEA2_ARAVE|nr:hypothetical protein AVEN_193406-1 [Araneus ventricosus]
MLNDVPPHIQQVMWFQQDEAPAHYVRDVRNYLDITFLNRWIGLQRVNYPLSSDLRKRKDDVFMLWLALRHLDFTVGKARKGIHEKTPCDVTACRREYLRTALRSEERLYRLGSPWSTNAFGVLPAVRAGELSAIEGAVMVY